MVNADIVFQSYHRAFLGFSINEMSCSSLDTLSDVSVLSSINSKVKAGRLNDD